MTHGTPGSGTRPAKESVSRRDSPSRWRSRISIARTTTTRQTGQMLMPKIPLLQRFWGDFGVGSPDDCGPWQGYKTQNGYAHCGPPHRTVKAHRLAFVLWPAG